MYQVPQYTKKNTVTTKFLSKAIRFVDVHSLKSIVGTERVLTNKQRRDNVKAMLDIISEVIFRIIGILHNKIAPLGSKTTATWHFPWCQQAKNAAIEKFDKSVAETLFKVYKHCLTESDKKLNYDSIRTLVSSIVLVIPSKCLVSYMVTPSSKTIAQLKRSLSSSAASGDYDNDNYTTQLSKKKKGNSELHVSECYDVTMYFADESKQTGEDDITMFYTDESDQNDGKDIELMDISE
jgi:DNA-directed RNA polymerase subunit M/transcription elongation factor TFIIS